MSQHKHCCCEEQHQSDNCQTQHEQIDMGCDCHNDNAKNGVAWLTLLKMAVSLICLLLSIFAFKEGTLSYIIITIGYLAVGADIIIKAAKNIIQGEFFDEYLLLVIATLGAIILGEYSEAIAVTLLFTLGGYFENKAVTKSKNTIKALAEIRPDTADMLIDGAYKTIPAQQVKPGDLFRVTAGMRIPLDGEVVEGASSVDMSALTGESLPIQVQTGSEIKSGGIVIDGMLVVRANSHFEDSTVSRILKLTRSEQEKKAKSVSFIRKFSKIYTPAVIALSALTAVLLPIVFDSITYTQSVYRALTFLVISCPCALVISVPMAFYSSIGTAARRGVLVKGSAAMEDIATLENIAFDKTGTITEGKFEVSAVNGNKTLELAAYAEEFSNHPIAICVKQAANATIDHARLRDYKEHAGFGVSVLLDDKPLLCGSKRHLQAAGITANNDNANLYVAYDGAYVGEIYIADKVKENASESIAALKKIGISKTIMLSGDHSKYVAQTAQRVGLTDFAGELLPQDKVAYMHKLRQSGRTAFVGDGINDAPVLTAADVGITMGGLGSQAAIEAADAVIMNDNLARLPYIITLARRTKSIVKFNIFFSIGVKIAILALAMADVTGMWAAILADVGVSLLAVLNSLRIQGK